MIQTTCAISSKGLVQTFMFGSNKTFFSVILPAGNKNENDYHITLFFKKEN